MFILSPATKSISITITISKELVPYFNDWYLRRKKMSDTKADFALRALKEAALADRAKQIVEEARITAEAVNKTLVRDFENESVNLEQ